MESHSEQGDWNLVTCLVDIRDREKQEFVLTSTCLPEKDITAAAETKLLVLLLDSAGSCVGLLLQLFTTTISFQRKQASLQFSTLRISPTGPER